MNHGPKLAKKADFSVEPVDGYPRVFIDAEAEGALLAHVDSSPTQEVCGILLGLPGEDERGPFVRVTRALEGKHAAQSGASVTFTHETWEYIHGVIEAEKLESVIVGWYHSHPGFGVFYSTHDTFIQQHFFSLPWQVGLVVDPSTGERGVFANLRTGICGATCYWRVVGEAGAQRATGADTSGSGKADKKHPHPNPLPDGEGVRRVECVYVDRVAAVDFDDRPSPETVRMSGGQAPPAGVIRITAEEALEAQVKDAIKISPHVLLLLIMALMGLLSLVNASGANSAMPHGAENRMENREADEKSGKSQKKNVLPPIRPLNLGMHADLGALGAHATTLNARGSRGRSEECLGRLQVLWGYVGASKTRHSFGLYRGTRHSVVVLTHRAENGEFPWRSATTQKGERS
jgi:proteasome lid subunit RPN8/RPN11